MSCFRLVSHLRVTLASSCFHRDVHTGTALTSYKNNACGAGGLALLGRDHFIAAQLGKPALHIWTWHKDQVHIRSFPPEPITSVACSLNGAFCAGGGASGAIHFWDVTTGMFSFRRTRGQWTTFPMPSDLIFIGTRCLKRGIGCRLASYQRFIVTSFLQSFFCLVGRLLRSWPAHYKRITCLLFSENGTELVAASEDTLISVWLLADVLDVQHNRFGSSIHRSHQTINSQGFETSIAPLHSWSEHTLPVTALAIGTGGCRAIVVSVGADRTVQIHSLGGGELLRTIVLPQPLTSVVMDPLEHSIYVGSSYGDIFDISLVGDAETEELGTVSGKPVHLGSTGVDVGVVKNDASLNSSNARESKEWCKMEGHTKTVTSLALTLDGALLVSGSEDCSVRVWDLRSRQPIRVLERPVKGPVSSVIVLDRPIYMPVGTGRRGGSTDAVSSGKGHKGPARPQPVVQLSKYATHRSQEKAPMENVRMLLDGSQGIDEDMFFTPGYIQKNPCGGGSLRSAGNEYYGYFDDKDIYLNDPGSVHGDKDVRLEGSSSAGMGLSSTETLEALKAENAALKLQAHKATQLAMKWAKLNADLISPDDISDLLKK